MKQKMLLWQEKMESELERRVVVDDLKRGLRLIMDMLENQVLREVESQRDTLQEVYAYMKVYMPQVI